MKTLPPFEEWPAAWKLNGWNNCFYHAASALDYLSNNDRPMGGESSFNAIDLEETACDIRGTLEAIKEYQSRT